MKKVLIITGFLFIFFHLNGQPIVINWKSELNEYRKIAKEVFVKAIEDYRIINKDDTLKIKEYFSRRDSIHYTTRFKVDSNSFLNMYLKYQIDSNAINKTIHLIFDSHYGLNSISILENGIEKYSSFYHDGYPYQISKKINHINRYLVIRYTNRKGKLLSVFSFNNSIDYVENGLSVLLAFGNSRKVSFLEYYDNDTLLYSLRNYQNGSKLEEVVLDSINRNLQTLYVFNKNKTISKIVYLDNSLKNSFISEIRFKKGIIFEEKIANKEVLGKNSGRIIYYDKNHNIIKIEQY